MILNSRFNSRPLGIFYVIKKPKVNILFVNANVGSPFLGNLAPPDSFYARSIGFNFPDIHHVLGLCCFPKIRKPVIRRIAINMVNHVFGPLSCCYSPCNSVGFVKPATYAYQNSSIGSFASSNVSNVNSFAVSYFPEQKSIFWIIFKHFFELFRRDHAQYLPQISGQSIGGFYGKP